jgi:outer membrane biosynthesis protein TonB
VGLDEDGHVADVQTIRDVPPLTAAALLAVKGWTFEPATLGAKAVASRIAIQVLFNPGNEAFGQAPPLATAANNTAQDQDYVSPRIQSAVYAHYPAQTLLSGAVVLDAQIGRSGRVGKATPVYTTASLVDAAAAAVKKWRFTPGQFKGSPVRSNVVVAIVFRSSTISTPYGSPQ